MKRRLIDCIVALAMSALPAATSAADKLLPPVPVPAELSQPKGLRDETARVRREGLETLVALANTGDPERLGFSTVPTLNGILVLDPFQDAVVQVSDLKTFAISKDPSSLIKLQAREIYPVAITAKAGTAGPLVVSSLTLVKKGTDWRATSYGSPNLMRAAFDALVNARDFKLPGQPQPLLLRNNQQHYLLVRITGLNKIFLGALGDSIPNRSELYLIPIFDSVRLGFAKGVPQLAATVFAKLKPDALLHNGLPT